MISRRHFLTTGAVAVVASKTACLRADAAPAFDAVVGAISSDLVTTNSRYFPTLTAALAEAPSNKKPYRVLLGACKSFEKVTINRPNVLVQGLSPELSQIWFDDFSGRSDGAGGTLGTRKTGTLSVTASNVTLMNLSIGNSFDYLAQLAVPVNDPTKIKDTQAVALAISDAADQTHLQNVVLDGYQDTVFADSGRALFQNCHIKGSVDFLFGAATVGLDHCQITSRLMPNHPNQGYVCAPSTLKRDPYGFVFFNCHLDHEGEPFPNNSTALARPWRPTMTFSDGRYGNMDALGACLYLGCHFGDHVALAGWDHMAYTNRAGSRVFLEPQEARFFISDCSGLAAQSMPTNYVLSDQLTRTLNPAKLLDLSNWTL